MLEPAAALDLARHWSSSQALGAATTPVMVVDFRSVSRRLLMGDADKRLHDAVIGSSWVNVAIVDDDLDPVFAPLVDGFDVIIGDGTQSEAAVDVHDVKAAIDRLLEAVRVSPVASVELVRLLRSTHDQPVAQALHGESLTYAVLQTGDRFQSWLAQRRASDDQDPRGPQSADTGGTGEIRPPVRLERRGSLLDITLDRPHRRNALNVAMRDQWFEALELLDADSSIDGARLRGAGENFCAGGDLDEFGTTPSPAAGHHVRMRRSLPLLMARVKSRLRVELHGACVGAGIELAAFAGSVVAEPGTTVRLPEIGFGLVPGAGGTVSLTRRCGRHRTAWLALTGATLDAEAALRWQIVDRIAPRS